MSKGSRYSQQFKKDAVRYKIVLLQKRTINDIAEVLLMLVPRLTRQLSGYIGELLGEIVTNNAVVELQYG